MMTAAAMLFRKSSRWGYCDDDDSEEEVVEVDDNDETVAASGGGGRQKGGCVCFDLRFKDELLLSMRLQSLVLTL
jgi:hypothetical protein